MSKYKYHKKDSLPVFFFKIILNSKYRYLKSIEGETGMYYEEKKFESDINRLEIRLDRIIHTEKNPIFINDPDYGFRELVSLMQEMVDFFNDKEKCRVIVHG